jgi:large subunit ribosomal protein L40
LSLRFRVRSLPQISSDVQENRAILEKQWAAYKKNQRLDAIQMLDRISFAQQRALDELRNESEELYQEAMQVISIIINACNLCCIRIYVFILDRFPVVTI